MFYSTLVTYSLVLQRYQVIVVTLWAVGPHELSATWDMPIAYLEYLYKEYKDLVSMHHYQPAPLLKCFSAVSPSILEHPSTYSPLLWKPLSRLSFFFFALFSPEQFFPNNPLTNDSCYFIWHSVMLFLYSILIYFLVIYIILYIIYIYVIYIICYIYLYMLYI